MSTEESKRNSSQTETQTRKLGNTLQPEAQHSTGNRKHRPFDDDETGTSGQVVDTTNPKMGGIDSSELLP